MNIADSINPALKLLLVPKIFLYTMPVKIRYVKLKIWVLLIKDRFPEEKI